MYFNVLMFNNSAYKPSYIFACARLVKTRHMTDYSSAKTELGISDISTYTKAVDSVKCADWLVKLRIFCAIYLPATREKNGIPVCIRDK